MELTRALGEQKRYNYLSLRDSELYDQIKDKTDSKSRQIKRLILEKAKESYKRHCSHSICGVFR